MKTLFYSLIFLFAGNLTSTAQKSEWTWAKGAGGSKHDYGTKIATDLAGNVYLTGCFISDTISFGGKTITNSGKGSSDVFVVKFDASGKLLWSAGIGGSADDRGLSVCADNSGNAWLIGDFESYAISVGDHTIINAGGSDVFIAHFDPSGNVLWASGAGGRGNEISADITADQDGNATITGTFESPVIAFGSSGLTNKSRSDTSDIFVAHFDASGKVLWAKGLGGFSNESSSTVIADKQGNIYLTGVFASDEIKFDETVLTNRSPVGFYGDVFISKYLPSGEVAWAKSIGGTRYDKGTGISIDEQGNVFLTGWFKSDSINFGCSVVKCTTLSGPENENAGDVFIAKYDSDGKPLWARRAGGMARDYGFSIATDAKGEVYLSGVFQVNFTRYGDITLRDATYKDIFITKYDVNGNELWGKSLYGAAMGHNITTDASGNVYLTGVFNSSEMKFSHTTLNNAGEGDIFLAKLKN